MQVMLFNPETINKFQHVYTFAELLKIFDNQCKAFEKLQINVDEFSKYGGAKGAVLHNFKCWMREITFQPSKQAFADVVSYLKKTI